MAGQKKFVLLHGGATVSIGDYVTAGGAGTLVDVGYTEGPTELTVTWEDYELNPEQEPGVIDIFHINTAASLKVPMLESSVPNIRRALRLPAANQTGIGDNLTLEIGGAGLNESDAETYTQLSLVGRGPGTTNVRTITGWKLIPESADPIGFQKGSPSLVGVTFRVLLDPSVAAAGKHLKSVDA